MLRLSKGGSSTFLGGTVATSMQATRYVPIQRILRKDRYRAATWRSAVPTAREPMTQGMDAHTSDLVWSGCPIRLTRGASMYLRTAASAKSPISPRRVR